MCLHNSPGEIAQCGPHFGGQEGKREQGLVIDHISSARVYEVVDMFQVLEEYNGLLFCFLEN